MYNLGLFSTALILMAMDGLNSVNFYKVSLPDRMALVVQPLMSADVAKEFTTRYFVFL